MKLGMTLGTFGPKIEIDMEAIREAESLGYDSVWSAEAWGNDAIVPLAWIGAQTSKIRLGTAIMQMPARTPAMCAMQMMTLDQLSGGRAMCGIGPSGPQVVEGWHGQAFGKPLTRTREYIAILRKIFARDAKVEFDGEYYQMPYKGAGASGLGKPLRSILHGRADIPVYTATISPKGVEVAAEIADGFIPVWTGPKGIETFLPFIEKGFAKAGGPRPLDIAPVVNVILHDDVEKARDFVRPGIALYVGGMGAREKNFYNDLVKRQGFPDEAKKIQDLYLDGKKNEAAAAVPDAMVDALSLVGPKEKIRDGLAVWKESSATTLVIGSDQRGRRAVAEILG